MKKTLILFTGPSTAGKTMFVQLLMDLDPNLHPMVQSSSRDPRTDDDPRFLRLYKPEDYEKQDFWIRSKQYGIINDDIQRFVASDQPLSIGIVGVRELIKAKEMSNNDLEIKVALVRLSSNPAKEEALMTENIRKYFANPEIRLEQNKRHLDEFFVNDKFIKNYVDLILPRDLSLSQRFHLFGNSFNHAPSQNVTEQQAQTLFAKLKLRDRY